MSMCPNLPEGIRPGEKERRRYNAVNIAAQTILNRAMNRHEDISWDEAVKMAEKMSIRL